MCWYIASNLMVHSLIFLNKCSFTQYHAIKLRKNTVSSSVLAVILVSVYLQVAVMLCWCVGILGVVLGIIRNFKSVLLSVGSHFKVSREHGVLSALWWRPPLSNLTSFHVHTHARAHARYFQFYIHLCGTSLVFVKAMFQYQAETWIPLQVQSAPFEYCTVLVPALPWLCQKLHLCSADTRYIVLRLYYLVL